MESEYLIIAKNLKMYFEIKSGISLKKGMLYVKAVDGVDIFIKKGEVVGVVGESGCGKTTVGRLLLNLIRPTDGATFFKPSREIAEKCVNNIPLTNEEMVQSIYKKSKREMRHMRKHMQIVFQDPMSSLDPRLLVKDLIAEPLFAFGYKSKQAYEIAGNLLEKVRLGRENLNKFPHQLSGGQRQRVAICRALALNPEFLILDEPTSALDVSVQSQILNILEDLKQQFNLTIVFISHHILVIRHISDRIMVMYLGKIVEVSKTEELFKNPRHPYTISLFSAVPVPDPKTKRTRVILEGEVPSPINPPAGCNFHTRCRFAFEKCGWTANELIEPVRSIIDPAKNPELTGLKIDKITAVNSVNLRVQFNNLNENYVHSIKSIIETKKTEGHTRALFGIASITQNGNELMFTMHPVSEPKLIKLNEEHQVSCFLYSSGKTAEINVVEKAKIASAETNIASTAAGSVP